jgi:ribose-phosphate pyrophosphokinase
MKMNRLIINLDENFKPFGEGIKIEKFKFPSGIEQHIKLHYTSERDEAVITTRIISSDDIIDVLLLTDILKKRCKEISLFIPYIPYGRQDRRTSYGEPFSLKVFADLINSQNYKNVYTFDTHSDVSEAVINNLLIFKNHRYVKSILGSEEDFYIICPDAGAYKKIYDVCSYIDYKKDIVICNKVRDINSGEIKKITVDADDLQGKDCYIIDDICSKGGTFIGISKELKLKNCGDIFLIVSHFEDYHNVTNILLNSKIRKIYSTNSIVNKLYVYDNALEVTEIQSSLM